MPHIDSSVSIRKQGQLDQEHNQKLRNRRGFLEIWEEKKRRVKVWNKCERKKDIIEERR